MLWLLEPRFANSHLLCCLLCLLCKFVRLLKPRSASFRWLEVFFLASLAAMVEADPRLASLAAMVVRKPVDCDRHGGVDAYRLELFCTGPTSGRWVWHHVSSDYFEPAMPLFSDAEQDELKERIAKLEASVKDLLGSVNVAREVLTAITGEIGVQRANAAASHLLAQGSSSEPSAPPPPPPPFPPKAPPPPPHVPPGPFLRGPGQGRGQGPPPHAPPGPFLRGPGQGRGQGPPPHVPPGLFVQGQGQGQEQGLPLHDLPWPFPQGQGQEQGQGPPPHAPACPILQGQGQGQGQGAGCVFHGQGQVLQRTYNVIIPIAVFVPIANGFVCSFVLRFACIFFVVFGLVRR